MKNLTRIVLIALAAAVLVSTVAVLTRRAVHATSYTVDPTGLRTPWTANCALVSSDDSVVASCSVTAPKGAELVIQTVSFSVITTTPSTVLMESVVSTAHAGTDLWIGQTVSTADRVAGLYRSFNNASTTLYADPGTSVTCNLEEDTHVDFSSQQACYLSGYYVLPS
jgi:hypothetical protein